MDEYLLQEYQLATLYMDYDDIVIYFLDNYVKTIVKEANLLKRIIY